MVQRVTIIVAYGDPILRKKCYKAAAGMAFTRLAVEEMKSAVMSTNSGVGISAPQIGVAVRMFVICDGEQKAFKTFVNPEIVKRQAGNKMGKEGCLSTPGVYADVPRSERITLRYYDLAFNEHKEKFKGFEARVIQHELDHLDGIMFFDHLSAEAYAVIADKIKKIENGEFPEIEYELK